MARSSSASIEAPRGQVQALGAVSPVVAGVDERVAAVEQASDALAHSTERIGVLRLIGLAGRAGGDGAGSSRRGGAASFHGEGGHLAGGAQGRHQDEAGPGRRRTRHEVEEFLEAKTSELEALMRKAEKLQRAKAARQARAQGRGGAAPRGAVSPASRPSSSSSSIRSDGYAPESQGARAHTANVTGGKVADSSPAGQQGGGGGGGGGAGGRAVKTGHNGGLIVQRADYKACPTRGAPPGPAPPKLALAAHRLSSSQGGDNGSAPSSTRSHESAGTSCVSSQVLAPGRADLTLHPLKPQTLPAARACRLAPYLILPRPKPKPKPKPKSKPKPETRYPRRGGRELARGRPRAT